MAARGQAVADATTLEPVVVRGDRADPVPAQASTATKGGAPLIETPQSVSVITHDQMDTRNVQSLSQALGYTAGVSVVGTGTDTRYDWPQIRGFSANTVGLFQDGLRWMPNQLSGRIDTYGLERIEVLKGPASVLYGQGAPGGLINLVTKMPTAQPLREVQVEYGSYAHRELKADLSGPIGGDAGNGHWLYRLTADGYDDNTQIDATHSKRLYVAPALTWQPDADTRVSVFANVQRDILGNFYPFLPAVGTVLPNPNGRIPTSFFSGDTDFNAYSRVQVEAGWVIEHRFDDTWTVRQNFRFNRFRVDDWKQEYGAIFEPDRRTLERFAFATEGDSRAWAVDNQVQAHFNAGRLEQTALVGLDYGSAKLTSSEIANFGQPVPIDVFAPAYGVGVPTLSPAVHENENDDQLGVYAQDQLKFDQRWVLLVGGRQDWAHSTVDDWLGGTTSKQSDHKFSGRIGAVYLSDSGLAPYASYSTSFLPNFGTDFAGSQLKPTTGRQIEAGVRYQPRGGRSYVGIAAFDIRERNVEESDPAHPGFAIQTGEVRSHGIEIEGMAALTAGLDLRFAYTADPVNTTRSADPAEIGTRPTVTPEHQASLWVDYALPTAVVEGAGLGAGVRYVGNSFGGTYTTPAGVAVPFTVPSVTLADLAMHYQLRQIRFAINVANLFDRTYVAGCYSGTACSYGDRRSVIGSVRYSW